MPEDVRYLAFIWTSLSLNRIFSKRIQLDLAGKGGVYGMLIGCSKIFKGFYLEIKRSL